MNLTTPLGKKFLIREGSHEKEGNKKEKENSANYVNLRGDGGKMSWDLKIWLRVFPVRGKKRKGQHPQKSERKGRSRGLVEKKVISICQALPMFTHDKTEDSTTRRGVKAKRAALNGRLLREAK